MRILSFKGIEPTALLAFDFSFLNNLSVQICKFFSSALPIQIVDQVLKHSKSLVNLKYKPIFADFSGMTYEMNIYIRENRFFLKHNRMRQNEELAFRKKDQLVKHLKRSTLAQPYLL